MAFPLDFKIFRLNYNAVNNKVEVIMKAFARVGLKEGLVGLLVMPRFVTAARFHRGENGDHAGSVSSFLQDLLYPVFFAEGILADELNFNPILGCDLFRVGTNLLAQSIGPLGIVKDPYPLLVQIGSHAFGKEDFRDSPCNHNSIQARENPSDLFRMALSELLHLKDLLQF
jgi:hypothetical protein